MKPKVAIVGGVDIGGRLEFMQHPKADCELCAVEAAHWFHDRLAKHGFGCEHYELPCRVRPRVNNSLVRLTVSALTLRRQFADNPGARDVVLGQLCRSDVLAPKSTRVRAPCVLLEAPTMELAIITADTLSCKDVIQHDRTGILFASKGTLSPADALERLLGDERSRKYFGENARYCSGKADERDVSDNPDDGPAIHRGIRG